MDIDQTYLNICQQYDLPLVINVYDKSQFVITFDKIAKTYNKMNPNEQMYYTNYIGGIKDSAMLSSLFSKWDEFCADRHNQS